MEMAYSIAKERRDQGLLEMPLTWEKNESVGADWYYGFMLCHSDELSLIKPEAFGRQIGPLWGMTMYLRGKISL